MKSWIKATGGNIPKDARPAGKEANGKNLFISRAVYNEGLHPGKVRPEFKAANIPWGGKEIKVENYEVFVGNGDWIEASGGEIPQEAIKAGHEKDGTPLYVARAYHEKGLHPGKVRPEFKAANIPWGGKEIKVNPYEVLVKSDTPLPNVPMWKASCLMRISYSNGTSGYPRNRYEGIAVSKEGATERAESNCGEAQGVDYCVAQHCKYSKE